MENEENQNSESIKEGEVLQIANNILSLLEYSNQLDDEEALFSDEFYISILSNLLTEQNYEIKPGETPEQKVKSLKLLIKLLSEIIETDLSQISAKGIIMEHDKFSAKALLELIEDLIKTLINANLEEEGEEEENAEKRNNKENNKENSDDLRLEKNNSENNFRKIRERMRLDDENEENNEENENSSYKRKYAELENGIDNFDDNDENFKEEDKDNNDQLLDINYDLENDKNNLSGSRVMNVSQISEMEKNKILGSSGKKKGIEQDKNKEKEISSKKKDKMKKNEKKYEDIPDLLINNIKLDEKNDNDVEEKEYGEDSLKFKNYLESNSKLEDSFLNNEENYYVTQSVPRAYNKLHLTNNSNELGSSNNHYIRSKKKSGNKKNELTEKKSSSNTNSNISFHSKNNKNKKNEANGYDNYNISSSNKKKLIQSENKSSNSKLKESLNSKSKMQEINKEKEIEEDDISKSSEYSDERKISKSSSSKKSKNSKIINKSKNSLNNSENNQKNIINLNFLEIPMSEEEMRYNIKKELRKLYGEKASRYFSKQILELIGENLKMARKEIIKNQTGEEADDFFSREFFQRYQKQMQQIIKQCIKQINQENLYKKNVIMNIGNNVEFMKKLKDAENKDMENLIQNSKKENESRNDDNNLNNLNQILMYPSYCYELQKNIYLMQTQNQIEVNYSIEKEREKNIEETKKSYDDKLSVLYGILRRQKKDRLNKKKFGEVLDYQLKNMKKSKLRQQVEDILDQIDEEDNKLNIYDNNKEEIEKIIKNIV